MGTSIFWSNLELWNETRKIIKELRQAHDYRKVGEIFTQSFITSIGGPLPDYFLP
jgi:hypothetical protein